MDEAAILAYIRQWWDDGLLSEVAQDAALIERLSTLEARARDY
jgi:hypothetical protein